MKKFKYLDLFAGAGGLTDGFMQSGNYDEVASVEWLKPQVDTLRHRLKTKWGHSDADEEVMRFDIQREKELFGGWQDDEKFGSGKGLDYFVGKHHGIDLVIGGPPCQAYSVAGRVRDENGMRDDYRNYLFEKYLAVVNRYRPKVFIFENVPGILSARPGGGKHVTELITEGFESIGYTILNDLRGAIVNAVEYGVPQQRKRVIILGIRRDLLKKENDADVQELLSSFYRHYLPAQKSGHIFTVGDAIGDLQGFKPNPQRKLGSRKNPYIKTNNLGKEPNWQKPRFQNERDIATFHMLAEDIASGKNEYKSSAALSKVYEEKVGSKSPIHRYHVLEKNKPSTTIIAHLYKDGNRFIHYDPQQARTITPREAARLQSFDDDFEFIGSQGATYQMIGNAVPPKLAKAVAQALSEFMKKNNL